MNILGCILGVLYQAIGLAPMAAAQSNNTSSFDLNEVWYVVIGAIIGFATSIGTIIVERILDRRGKLKIYYRINGDKRTILPFGFARTQDNDISFSIPMQIEVQNTSRTNCVIRDLNVTLYKDGVLVDHMVQITSVTNNKTENGKTVETQSCTFGAENSAYSFVVEPLSIRHEYCCFLYLHGNAGKVFDEVKIRYFDNRDKEHVYSILKIQKCWAEKAFEGTHDWVLLK